jgi:hypothetical protein
MNLAIASVMPTKENDCTSPYEVKPRPLLSNLPRTPRLVENVLGAMSRMEFNVGGG